MADESYVPTLLAVTRKAKNPEDAETAAEQGARKGAAGAASAASTTAAASSSSAARTADTRTMPRKGVGERRGGVGWGRAAREGGRLG